MAILVSGGAGYIGSHAVLALQHAGRPVAVIDNLVKGAAGQAVQCFNLMIGVDETRALAMPAGADFTEDFDGAAAGQFFVPEPVTVGTRVGLAGAHP